MNYRDLQNELYQMREDGIKARFLSRKLEILERFAYDEMVKVSDPTRDNIQARPNYDDKLIDEIEKTERARRGCAAALRELPPPNAELVQKIERLEDPKRQVLKLYFVEAQRIEEIKRATGCKIPVIFQLMDTGINDIFYNMAE